jgi:threonine/homoserine/homoserine lactone efflux protein
VITAILAFAGIAAITNLTPGLDMMLVLRTSVSGGRRAGLAAAGGITTGCLAWGIATAVGGRAHLRAQLTGRSAPQAGCRGHRQPGRSRSVGHRAA